MDPKDEVEPGVRENLTLILNLLKESLCYYAITGYICKRDYECIAIEWPRKGIFCYIFNDSITIDKVIYHGRDIVRNQIDILVSDLNEKFIETFLASL